MANIMSAATRLFISNLQLQELSNRVLREVDSELRRKCLLSVRAAPP
jgi:hypothetical protein